MQSEIPTKIKLRVRLETAAKAIKKSPNADFNLNFIADLLEDTERFLTDHDFISAQTLANTQRDADRFAELEACMGHLQNGSQTDVKIWQDDAALSEEAVHLTIGKKTYYGSSLGSCILQAVEAVEAGETERH